MAIQVRLFASLRERAGWGERLVTPETPPATPLSLWRQLQLPDGGPGGRPDPGPDRAPATTDAAPSSGGDTPLPAGIRVAINRSFAAPDTPLADGDELAFLPPISGG